MPRSLAARIAIAVTAALVLAACGDDRATTPQPPTEEDTGEGSTEEDPPAFEEAEPETEEAEPAVEEPADESAAAREEPAEDASLEPDEESPVANEEERASGDARGGSVDPGLEEEVEFAIQDTVDQTGVSRSDVEVQLAERVTWNDGSLGCPRPGEMYTQALVEGYRILLSADGQERAYHGRDGADPSYCANPRPASGEGSGGAVDR
jgi:hypothetical protein